MKNFNNYIFILTDLAVGAQATANFIGQDLESVYGNTTLSGQIIPANQSIINE